MTPPAIQRTSFEENCGPNAWPVVDGESLDIEDDACGQSWHLFPERAFGLSALDDRTAGPVDLSDDQVCGLANDMYANNRQDG